MRKSQNQGLRADPEWSKNSGKMESNPGGFPDFRCLRALSRSSGVKESEILWPSSVGIFHRSDSSLLMSLVDSRFPVLCASFFTSYKAMVFAETGHWRKERPNLPVSLLIVLRALRLECEKSIEFTASSHWSCFFCCSRDSRDEAAQSESVPTQARMDEWWRVSHSLSKHSTQTLRRPCGMDCGPCIVPGMPTGREEPTDLHTGPVAERPQGPPTSSCPIYERFGRFQVKHIWLFWTQRPVSKIHYIFSEQTVQTRGGQ